MLPTGSFTAIAIGVGLLIVTLIATTAGSRHRESSVGRVTGYLTVALAYLVAVFAEFTNTGMDLGGLLLLAIAMLIPILAGVWGAAMFADTGSGASAVARRRLVVQGGLIAAFLLICVQLIVAGRVLSILGGVNPAVASIALGVVVSIYVVSRGWRGSTRTSRWTIFFVVLAGLVLVAGLFLGSLGSLVDVALPSQGYSIGHIIGVLLALAALGAVDLVLIRSFAEAKRADAPRRAIGGGLLAVGTVVALGAGLLLFFGGSFFAPSEQLFTLFTTMGAVGLAVLCGLAAMLLASTTDSYLAAAGDCVADLTKAQDHERVREFAVAILAILAVVVAAFAPPISTLLVMGAILSAAVLGVALVAAPVGDGLRVFAVLLGVLSGFVVAFIAGLGETFAFGDWSGLAIAFAAVVGIATVLLGKSFSELEPSEAAPAPSETSA